MQKEPQSYHASSDHEDKSVHTLWDDDRRESESHDDEADRPLRFDAFMRVIRD